LAETGDVNALLEATHRTFMVTRRRDGSPTCHDEPDFRAVAFRGEARNLSIDETLASDAPKGVVLARGIGMEGVKKVEDAPDKFVGEDPEDWLKRAAEGTLQHQDGARRASGVPRL
jgi:hypothetical protein